MKTLSNPSQTLSQTLEALRLLNRLSPGHIRCRAHYVFNLLAIFACVMVLIAATKTNAEPVEFFISLDDYVEFYVAGQLVASYDAYPWGTASVTLDLAPGWHDIRMVYRNRWGSNALYFYKRQNDDTGYVIVSRSELRSFDDQDRLIDGLRADYAGFTIYGEGPIAHGYPDRYQDQTGLLWAGTYDGWTKFSETLTGQVFVRNTAPNITDQPLSQTVTLGDTVSLCVAATGAEPSYQWRFNGENLEGATNDCLVLTNANYARAGRYSVQVSNATGTTASAPALLSFLDVQMFSGLTLAGPIGATYRIECASEPATVADWHSLTNVTLSTSPQMWFDMESPGQARRYYRAMPLE